jgi:predicted RNA-binding Zn-ribbon protein involved in translation (DUF1610 family)
MTREEAIDYLKRSLAIGCEDDDIRYHNEVLEFTIKALEQEPREDAISRAEALKAINKMDIPEDMSVFEIKSHIGMEIGTLPPVQPKPMTGHWIHLKHNKGKCSECHDVVLIAQMYGNANYCPNCGARMIEPQEIHCNCTDEEIAKSFIEDVEAVKDLLPIAESEENNG